MSTGGRTGGISQRPHEAAPSHPNAAGQNEKTAALQTVTFTLISLSGSPGNYDFYMWYLWVLYFRKYIFAFHENLQKLVYMGLVQFGHVEKFKEKDQVHIHESHNATETSKTCDC